MISDRVFVQYRSKGVLIDTNLLLVCVDFNHLRMSTLSPDTRWMAVHGRTLPASAGERFGLGMRTPDAIETARSNCVRAEGCLADPMYRDPAYNPHLWGAESCRSAPGFVS
jgi:hypothetical protein